MMKLVLGSSTEMRELDRAAPRRRLRHSTFVIRHSLRQPPIHHQHFAVVAEHEVLGLQIAVDDSPAVRKGERVAHFLEDGEQRGEGAVLSARFAVPSILFRALLGRLSTEQL